MACSKVRHAPVDPVPDPTCTRRTALRLGALAPGLAVAAGMASDQALDAFVSLCARLTGFPAHSLDRQFASDLFQALIAQGVDREVLCQREDDCRRERTAEEHEGFDRSMNTPANAAVEIVSAWYTGVLPTTPQPTVAKFRDALVWRTLDFATAQTICTAPGAWADAPVSNQGGHVSG